jgi:hypothetical protein
MGPWRKELSEVGDLGLDVVQQTQIAVEQFPAFRVDLESTQPGQAALAEQVGPA